MNHYFSLKWINFTHRCKPYFMEFSTIKTLYYQIQGIQLKILYFLRYYMGNFGSVGQRPDRDVTADTCWKELTLGFKIMFIVTMLICIPQLSQNFAFNLLNYYVPIIYQHEFWRPFVALFFCYSIRGIFSMLIAFLWLYNIVPIIEKEQSTIFMLINAYIKAVTIDLLFVPISWLLVTVGLPVPQMFLFRGGMFLLLIVQVTILSGKNPQEYVSFCWVPCKIKQKYVPLFLVLIQGAIGFDLIGALIAFGYGYIEGFLLKTYLIKLPIWFYTKLENCLPEFIKNYKGYIKVSNSLPNIRNLCCCSDQSNNQSSWQEDHVDHRVKQNGTAKVQVAGGGSTIGSSFKGQNVDARNVWIKKAQNMQLERKKAEINNQNNQQFNDEIQPQVKESNQQQNSKQTLQE